MSDISDNTDQLKTDIDQARTVLDIEGKKNQLSELSDKMQKPDFWNDNKTAQEISKNHAALEKSIKPWLDLSSEVDELAELIKLNDSSLEAELNKKLELLNSRFTDLKQDLKHSSPHDGENAVLTISAGAGGTDAQDWAEMLSRMYLRWAEKEDLSTNILEESKGEEAGLKSIAIKFNGLNAYGKLKSEHGVHRLVRLSPFNSANSRETSFAMVEAIPEITKTDVVIDDGDIKVDVYRAGGRGGQSVNTTDSAVRVTHQPTGIVVAIQNERSQQQNKEIALRILTSKLLQLAEEQHQDKIEELKGPNKEAAWGNQIRSYVLHPYTMVKDLRTNYETSDVQKVLDGDLNQLIDAYLEHNLSG